MANINNYSNDSVINPSDKVIGSDGAIGADLGKTKNFTVSSITNYISAQTLAHPVVITGLIEAASDSESATSGVPIGGVYKNSGQLYIRES